MIEGLLFGVLYFFALYAILTGGNLRWILDEIEDWWEARKS